jgi:hypothetical protein
MSDRPPENGSLTLTADGAGVPSDIEARRRFVPAATSSRYVYLKPVSPEDYGFLRRMDLREGLGARWRFRGGTPGMEQWVQGNQGVLAHFLVMRARDHAPLGVTAVYQHNFQDQHAYLASASFQPENRSPLLLMGVALFIEYVFTCWPFRKLYLELPEFNVVQVGRGLGRLFVEEGRLREHMYYDGQFWDKLILALYRSTWEVRSQRLLGVLSGEDHRQERQ